MCGIFGYVGQRRASEVVLNGLTRLEYRGYDSAGIAVQSAGGIKTYKTVGPVAKLAETIRTERLDGLCAIGHTRWATHGAPTTENAHPHCDCTGELALVHNGVIENAEALREVLRSAGHTFRSQTDTETIAHLIEQTSGETLEERVCEAVSALEGTYGLAVMSAREPGKIVVARHGSPVLLGLAKGELLVASDAAPLLPYTRSVTDLEDGDVAVLTHHGHRVLDGCLRTRTREPRMIDWDVAAADLGGCDTYMHKEIHEQPKTVMRTLSGRLVPDEGRARLDGLNLAASDCRRIRRIIILGCGTSWHAGLVGRHAIERLASIPVQVEYASEFRYQARLDLRDTLAIVVSQSGETADTLEALRAAKEAGATVLGIVNAVGSTIAREASGGVYLHAGPEIGVASTKAFTSQVVALVLIGLWLGRNRGLSIGEGRALTEQLLQLPRHIWSALQSEAQIEEIARQFVASQSLLYLGRGINFPVALEGALKLKEVSYIHAEGYPAAEMKHGPIALIDESMPVVVVAPRDGVYAKTVSNMQEVRARGGRIIAVSTRGNGDLSRLAEFQLPVPAVPELLSPVITVIPLQLLAYHIAVLRECDVDRPRNLAKSVTVE